MPAFSQLALKGMTRRDLLRGAAAASTLTAARCAGAGPAAASPSLDLPGAEELTPENMPARFSRDEMTRRWGKVRERMKREQFDCLLVPPRPQGDADIKYLIESPANWVIFPLEGQVTAVYRRDRDGDALDAGLGVEKRVSLLRRSRLVIDRLKELGLSRARVGVGNLDGTVRDDEGSVSYTALDRVKRGLPRARFDSAVDLLMRVKLARGPEEIEVLRLASRVSELGIRALVETARPGVTQREAWFRVFKTLLDASGEIPGRISIRGGDEANVARGRPGREKFEAGQIMNQEISGSVLGYNSQVNHSICVGPPAPADWHSACSYCIDLFHSLVDWIEPGKSFTEFGEFYRDKVEERGEGYWGVVFHTGGALGDGPRMGPTRPDENQDLVLEPGNVFTVKPRIPIKGVPAPAAQVGDAVLVTESGGQRLGRRKLEVLTLGA